MKIKKTKKEINFKNLQKNLSDLKKQLTEIQNNSNQEFFSFEDSKSGKSINVLSSHLNIIELGVFVSQIKNKIFDFKTDNSRSDYIR